MADFFSINREYTFSKVFLIPCPILLRKILIEPVPLRAITVRIDESPT